MTIEQRRAQRTRMVLGCRIEFGPGGIVECHIREMSTSGARMEIPGGVVLPSTFRIFVPSYRRWRDTQVRWQERGFAGVQFSPDEVAWAISAEDREASEAHAAGLHAEIRRLQDILAAVVDRPGSRSSSPHPGRAAAAAECYRRAFAAGLATFEPAPDRRPVVSVTVASAGETTGSIRRPLQR